MFAQSHDDAFLQLNHPAGGAESKPGGRVEGFHFSIYRGSVVDHLQRVGLSVRAVLFCWTVLLAASSNALGFERRDGAYYCTVQFSGGIAYNESLKRWQGTSFQPSGNFVVRLKYLKSRTVNVTDKFSYDIDDYDVHITDEGANGYLHCGAITNYEFNFKNNRFLEVYAVGYVNGVDKNGDTPSVSGGTCTKIP